MHGYNAADIRKKAAEKAMASAKKKKKNDDEESKPKLGSGERFKKLSGELEKKGAKDPKALAAYIGRQKYGAKKMAKMAAAGRKKG